ncbi:hypothetical protein B0A55_06960 [Friedmanniomyces simplex]|uniref:Alternative oxidase n=1 Tax=Friedmanniomyces simplex TaxID=329884 RepID=A0A4V5NFT6_9PEZI|nr:hypothetical protein B0A55_06960 [Friedmanniomyces simplex]
MYAQSFTNRPPAFYAALVVVTLLPLYLASYHYRLWHPYGGADPAEAVELSSAAFVAEWLDVHVVQPFNPSTIATYCNRTEWHPNLVFNLVDGAEDGLADARGSLLDFLFYAIEAGASIVLPGFAANGAGRNASRIAVDKMPFGMLFDEAWLLSSMAEACPQMAIYKPERDHKTADALPGTYVPKSRRVDMDSGKTKKAYLEHLDAWLKEKPDFKPDRLTLVNVERTSWQVDTRNLPQVFRRSFGQVLRTADDIRRLAAVAVQELTRKFTTHIDSSSVVPRNAFYGAYVDTRGSVASEPYSNFSAQTDAHLEQAIMHKLKVIYVASDNATETALFRTAAARYPLPIIAVSKLDLLPVAEVAALKELTPTQQVLVDFEVLKRCSIFGGSVKSSASYNIALTRNQWLADQGRMNDPWFVVHKDVGVAFDDGISRIVGRDGVYELQMPRGMWP